MKIKVTEIEASAEELKASQSLSSSLSNLLRNALMPGNYTNYTEETDEQNESEDE